MSAVFERDAFASLHFDKIDDMKIFISNIKVTLTNTRSVDK